MDIERNKPVIWILLLTGLLGSCNLNTDEPAPVISVFTVQPENGNTTTRFEIDATPTFAGTDEEHPVLIRYDWQNDGFWDQDYTSSPKLKHRYLKPGIYTIRMEARNMAGVRDTSSLTIAVIQGYSAPVAAFKIIPDSADLYTLFKFDASSTYDDEDSANLLLYRWDFDGDGNWDTGFEKLPVASHLYTQPGKYQVGIEVKDPTNRSTVLRKAVTVDLLNDSIRPAFKIEAGFSTVTTILKFDASGSSFLNRPDKVLTYSWDIFNDGLWEAIDQTTPVLSRVINKEGVAQIKLRVKDDRGLYMDTIRKIEIFPENARPVAVMIAGNHVGNPKSAYLFSSFGTTDRETSILDLKYQWDTNEDGQWESQYENIREITCSFPEVGTHRVTLKVTDDHENSSIATDSVAVFPGQHETAIAVDNRPYPRQYYGTVKIGKLWWMQENMVIEIKPGPNGMPPALVRWCYNGDIALCERYGGLYSYKAVRYPVCPSGWRLPARTEFQEMVALEAPNGIAPLLWGGSSEMHILMGGYIDMSKHSLGFGSATNFWLSDRTTSGSPFVWYIDVARGVSRAVAASETYGYSVRCVKSD